jgi:hypothetical protein
VPVPITGGMLLGHGFISSTYVHMGFHPAWKFETVIELLLEGGVVTGTMDRSDEISVIRQRIEAGAIANPDGHLAVSTGWGGPSPSITAAASPAGRARK